TGKSGESRLEGEMQARASRKQALSRQMVSPLSLWVASLAVVAVVVAVALVLTGYTLGNPWVVLGLAAGAGLAERGRVRLNRYLEESISLLPTLFAAVVFGPLAAMLVAAASMIGAFWPPYLKWANYTCTRDLTGSATGLAAGWAADLKTNHIASVVIATTVGTLVSQALD